MKNQFKKAISLTIAGALTLSVFSAIGNVATFTKTTAKANEIVSEDIQTIYKVMPLGDSITAGWCPSETELAYGGYRTYLTKALEENGYSKNFDFVGKWQTGKGYDTDNNGTNGACIAYDQAWANSILTDVVDEKILDTYTPDIVLLQIGTNDINSQSNRIDALKIDTINDRLENLIDVIFSKLNENSMLFLASIPNMQGESSKYNEDVKNYNEFIREVVDNKIEEGKRITFVDVNAVVADDQFDDALHPNQSGYESMGELWYGILTDYMMQEEQKKREETPQTPAPTYEPATTPAITSTPTPQPAKTAAPVVTNPTNKCQSVTASKKKVTIKKNKSKKITFKITNTNASEKTTDVLSVSSNKAFVTAKILKSEATTVTVKVKVSKKAKKKAKANVTLKVGEKSATTKVICA